MMTRQIRKGYDLNTIIDTLKLNGIQLLTLDFKTTNDICEYKCQTCSHEFKTSLKFKFGQIKKGKIGCPVCSKKEQVKKYIEKDPLTGKSKANINAEKSATTMKKINPKTGLSIYGQTGDKIKKTVYKKDIDGNTLSKIRGQKTKITKHKINPITGKTNYQETAEKSALTSNEKFLIKLKEELKDKFILDIDAKLYFKDKQINFKCVKCNTHRKAFQKYIRCYVCNPINNLSNSRGELEVLEYCKSITNLNIISGDRTILKNNRELDVYIPDLKLAFEYNGSYYHSEIRRNDKFHIGKTNECLTQSIQLLHIWETEWENPIKQEIWKSIIRNKLGKSNKIYARKTEIKQVNSQDKTTFLNVNHLQGNSNSSINIGLYLDNELVSLMTFGKSRYKKDVDWELLRFCNKINYSVIGGASKLLKAFKQNNIGSIISYADKCRSNGNLYKSLGFDKLKDSKVGYWWWKADVMENRWNFQKHMLSKKLKIFDKNKSEVENMHDNNYVRIFNCGNQVWFLNK